MAGHEGSPGTLRSGQQAGPVARAPGLDADATEVLGALIQLPGGEPREPVTVETIAATCAAPRHLPSRQTDVLLCRRWFRQEAGVAGVGVTRGPLPRLALADSAVKY
jgi:hypothetical protein